MLAPVLGVYIQTHTQSTLHNQDAMAQQQQQQHTYKFRAECQADIKAFEALFHSHIQSLTVVPDDDGFPDAIATLVTTRPIVDILATMDAVPDGHVMMETLNTESSYTGERTYDGGDALLGRD